MFIGGLSWQTSPGMFTSVIDFFDFGIRINPDGVKIQKFIGLKRNSENPFFFHSFLVLFERAKKNVQEKP